MLVSLKAGGTGLNLTAADHVFLLDPWWNPAVEDQAADRAHRIGQDRPVMVYRLVTGHRRGAHPRACRTRSVRLADAALGDAALAAGSRATISSPCSPDREDGTGRAFRRGMSVAFSLRVGPKVDVLIVDDNPFMRAAVTRILQRQGCQGVAVATLDAAKMTLIDHPPAVVLTDFSLGTRDTGVDLVRWIRGQPGSRPSPAGS